MNKRGIIKKGIFVILILACLSAVYFSFFSSAQLVKEKYFVGEIVKLDLREVKNYKAKIIAPSESFIKQGSEDIFVFKTEETGKYQIILITEAEQKEYSFEVFENLSNETSEALDFFNESEIDLPYELEVKVNRNSVSSKEVKILKKNDDLEVKRKIPESWKITDEENIKIYLEEERKEIEFSVIDSDNDTIIDEVNWTAKNLAVEQTFGIIIITKAEHLDSNRTFISDIYNSVQELDSNFSEEIKDGEYVRVIFEKNLTSENDITLWPRITSGNPKIEVYEVNGKDVIANFNGLIEDEYNKVFLENLVGEQNTFDLRVIEGSVQFDHIIDPPTIYRLVISSSQTLCGEVNNYTEIYVTSTGVLNICPFNTTIGTGYVNISLGKYGNFTVDAGGVINGSGAGAFNGSGTSASSGTGTQGTNGFNRTVGVVSILANGGGGGAGNRIQNLWGAGGGGGGFGGSGGRGGNSTTNSSAGFGGGTYGTSTGLDLFVGSGAGGGAGDAARQGGRGGGGFKVNVSSGYIFIRGIINVSGQSGNGANDADTGSGGGGSGGHIILIGDTVNINSSIISTTGGNGGNTGGGVNADDCGGGGGGGGRIVIVHNTYQNLSAVLDVSGGSVVTGGCTVDPAVGSAGTITNVSFTFPSQDFTAPSLNITFPLNNSNFSSRTQTINYTVSDVNLNTCWWTNNSGTSNNTITCGNNISATWLEGINNVTIYANDTWENVNSSVISFFVDTIYPLIDFGVGTENNNSVYQRRNIYVNVTVNETRETNITFLLYNSSGNYNTTVFTIQTREINWTDLPTGFYSFNVTVRDSANNANTTISRTVVVDGTPPEWINQSQSKSSLAQGEINNLFVNFTDNYALDKVWLATNESGTWVNYTARKTGLTMSDFTGISLLEVDPISASASINSVLDGFVRESINLSYNYDSGVADDTFDVVVNVSLTNISLYQNISYYVRADISNRHRTNLVIIDNASIACSSTTPVTISDTNWNIVTFNIAGISGCNLSYVDRIRVRFSDDNDATTGTGNITLDELFLTSDLLREALVNFTWKNSSLSSGSVSWRVYMNDSVGNLNQTDILTFSIQDLNYPLWSNPSENPSDPVTYSLTQSYQFNTTWIDNVAVQTVRMQHNFTGTMQNYSISGNTSSVYYYNYTSIPAGAFSWQMIANDTSGNTNQTDFYTYTVNRASSSVNLTLNGVDGNVTVQVGNNNVNLTGYRILGEGNIRLYSGGLLINEGSPSVFNFSNFTSLGDYNITVIYDQTQNYSQSSRTNYLLVRDNLKPNVTMNAPINFYNSSSRNIIFNTTVREDYNLTNISILANFSGSFAINQTNTSGLNGEYLFSVLNIPDGRYIWAVIACDLSNNCNQSENRTLIVDTVYPLIDFGVGTENDQTNFTRDWIYVNVSVTETNEANITFGLSNLSGVYNITTFTNGMRSFNWSNVSNGVYFYNVTLTDYANNVNTTQTRTIRLDTTPPSWSAASENPTDPATYSSGQFYQFNTTWTDNVLGVQTVRMQHNFTGTMQNYTITGNSGSIYYYNYTNFGAGTYSWQMIANDSLGNVNQTDFFTYTVSRASSSVNLTLNGSDSNVTIQVHNNVNLTGYRLIGEGVISLHKNGILINYGSTSLENITSFNHTGTYNITVIYDQTQNYSQSSRTNYVIVQDNQMPGIVLNTPINFYNSSIRNINFNVSANDNYNISNVSLLASFSGSFAINQTNSSGFRGDYNFNVLNIPDGRYNWSSQVCDLSNNCNLTFNRTITIDATPPAITAGAINVSNSTLNTWTRVNCTVTDAFIGLDTVLVGAQKPTLPQENYSTSILTGNTRYADIHLIEVGNWTFSCYANDTFNNLAAFHIGNVTITQAADAPSIPVLLYPVDGANLSAVPQFNWTNSTDPNGDTITYIIEIDLNPGFNSPEYYNGGITETNDPTEDISVTLAQDGEYFWRVRASDGGTNSSFSASRSFVLDRDAPDIFLVFPSNNTNLTYSHVNFTWNVTDNLGYQIYCNLTINSSVNVTNFPSNNANLTNYTVNGVFNGFKTWNVTCFDRVGNINTSLTREFTIYTVGFSTNVNISFATDNSSVIIRWSNTSSATSFNVYISNNYSAGFSSTPNHTGITSLNFTDTNASQSSTRFYRVGYVNGPAENVSVVTIGKIQPPQLTSGFNLISWPLNSTNFVLNNGLNNGYNPQTQPQNCILSLFRYNGSKFQETTNDLGVWTPATGDADFVSIEPLKGYWYETNSSCNVTFLGEVPRVNITTSLNFTFNVVSWNSAYSPDLGEEATLGNSLYVSPANSIDNIFRYNTSKATSNPQLTGFQGMHHFVGYGWWPFFGDEDFNKLVYGEGYYLEITTSQSNWTHNPNFNN